MVLQSRTIQIMATMMEREEERERERISTSPTGFLLCLLLPHPIRMMPPTFMMGFPPSLDQSGNALKDTQRCVLLIF
jgi:hypothetical protein